MSDRSARIVVAVCVAAVLALAEPADAQCAMCRNALQSPEARALVTALRSGILLLLAAPFLVFGCIAFLAVAARRAAGSEPAGQSASATRPPVQSSGTVAPEVQ